MNNYKDYKVEVICVSHNNRDTLITYQMTIPRFLLPELEKHRNLSMSVESSRAVSLDKTTSGQPLTFIPLWTLNQKGMRGKRITDSQMISELDADWENAKQGALDIAIRLHKKQIHKQNVNRLLEPFMFVNLIVTLEASALKSLLHLRRANSGQVDRWSDTFPAQPEFQVVADMMWEAYLESESFYVAAGEWHVPYLNTVHPSEEELFYSVGRCANISYGVNEYSFEKFVEIGEKMLKLNHPSPTEHQCKYPSKEEKKMMQKIYNETTDAFEIGPYYSNFQNWIQFRKILERK